jgi:hypothetical protein
MGLTEDILTKRSEEAMIKKSSSGAVASLVELFAHLWRPKYATMFHAGFC